MEPSLDTRVEKPNGAEIKRLRKSLGMTATNLADAAGVSLKSIGNAEAGKKVYVNTLKRIADALKVLYSEVAAAQVTAKSESRINAEMKLSSPGTIPLQRLDEEGLANFMALLQTLTKSQSIDVERVDGHKMVVMISLEVNALLNLVHGLSIRWEKDVEVVGVTEVPDLGPMMGYPPKSGGWRPNMRLPSDFFMVSELSIPKQPNAPSELNGKKFRDNRWKDRRRGLTGIFIRFLDLFRR